MLRLCGHHIPNFVDSFDGDVMNEYEKAFATHIVVSTTAEVKITQWYIHL